MSSKFNHIDVFNNSSVIYMRKPSIKIFLWIIILLIGSTSFGLLAVFYKYDIFNIYYANVVENDDEYYLSLNVDATFYKQLNRNYLTINDKDYECHLEESSDNFYIVNNEKMWEVSFKCELPQELRINNNVVEVKIVQKDTTLFKSFINKIRKDFKNGRTKK